MIQIKYYQKSMKPRRCDQFWKIHYLVYFIITMNMPCGKVSSHLILFVIF